MAPASGEEQGGQGQALPHGGAGPIEAQIGHPRPPGGKGGADALVQQVPRQEKVQLLGLQLGPFQRRLQGHLLHGGLRHLPAGLLEGVVFTGVVKKAAQGALFLLAASGAAVAHDDGGTGELIGLGRAGHRQRLLQENVLPLVCAPLRNLSQKPGSARKIHKGVV